MQEFLKCDDYWGDNNAQSILDEKPHEVAAAIGKLKLIIFTR